MPSLTTQRRSPSPPSPQRQHELEDQQKQQRERDIAAGKTATAICALNAELDQMITQLGEGFERRRSLLAKLADIDPSLSTLIVRMASKSGPTSAACKIGLDRFIAIERTAAHVQCRLTDSNAVLAGIGAKPEGKPTKPQRVQLS
jgi:hypothetical protein